jgi:subtilisin
MGRPDVRRTILLFLLAALMGTLVPVAEAASAARSRRYIIVFEDSTSNPKAVAREHADEHSAVVSQVYQHALKGYAARMSDQAAARIASDPRVALVEEDHEVHAFGEVPTGLDRMEVDKKSGLGDATQVSTDVDIAILDTGIGPHFDLNVVGGVNCTGTPSSSSCSSGKYDDDNAHGTHVAGTTAGLDNGAGVVGVAPGARLWAVKVLDSRGSGYISWIVAGIDWVRSQAATMEVANMSLGCECTSSSMNTALTNATSAGVVFVAAAGNSAENASTFSPANHSKVIAVSAMADFNGKAGGGAAATCRADEDDSFANFSNFGSVVDIAAPGVCINSTVPGGGYDTFSGTSMASPHAAGAAAIYIVENAVPQSSSRWSTVLSGLQSAAWSVPQSDPCGFTNGKSAELMLMLALPCDTTAAPPPPPSPPVGSDDSASTPRDTAATIDVLANDTDANGDRLTVTNLGTGSSGTTTLNASNTAVIYTPNAGFTGTDSFTYTANDGTADGNIATVTVTVTEAPPDYRFTATGRKVRSQKYVDLSWNAVAFASTSVDVWRNGLRIGSTGNDGFHTDGPLGKGTGTYHYFICETGNPDNCSNVATVVF